MKTKNLKLLNDGRYRLNLPEDIRGIFTKALIDYRKKQLIYDHEMMLADEVMEALQKEQIKLRKSEFFLLFSKEVQRHVGEHTQTYIASLLNMDEVKRQMIQNNRRKLPNTSLLS
jgi:hypothetical protein